MSCAMSWLVGQCLMPTCSMRCMRILISYQMIGGRIVVETFATSTSGVQDSAAAVALSTAVLSASASVGGTAATAGSATTGTRMGLLLFSQVLRFGFLEPLALLTFFC